jgi:hypothetical protein
VGRANWAERVGPSELGRGVRGAELPKQLRSSKTLKEHERTVRIPETENENPESGGGSLSDELFLKGVMRVLCFPGVIIPASWSPMWC